MSNITERTDAPKGFVRDMKSPYSRGVREPNSASASGILATCNIDPLKPKSEAEEWAATTRPAGAATDLTQSASDAAGTATGIASSAAATAASMTAGAAKLAYGTAVGDEQMKKQGSEQVWGKPSQ